MAQRRMFSPAIVCSDAFLDMSSTARDLYYQLGMYADDDGFVNPRKIMRMLGSSEDDLKLLIVKRFVLPFPSGVLVIKHWKINNLVRKDWYRPTQYLEEKNTLKIKENGAYTELLTSGLQLVNESSTEVRLGKDRIVIPSPSVKTADIPDLSIPSLTEEETPKKAPQNKQYEEVLAYMAQKRSELTGEDFKFVGRRTGDYAALKAIKKLMSNGRAYEIWEELCESEFWQEKGFTLWDIIKQFKKKGK